MFQDSHFYLLNNAVQVPSTEMLILKNYNCNYWGFWLLQQKKQRSKLTECNRKPSWELGYGFPLSKKENQGMSCQSLAQSGHLWLLKCWLPERTIILFSNSFVISDSPYSCWQLKVWKFSGFLSQKTVEMNLHYSLHKMLWICFGERKNFQHDLCTIWHNCQVLK